MNIKKGDNIIVIAGKHKGEKGSVAKVAGERVIVGGINKMKVHLKPKNRNEKGSIVEREASLHASNVMVLDAKGKRTRIGKKEVGGKMIRIARTTGSEIK